MRRSEMRELVQLPMKTTSMGWPEQRLAAFEAHVLQRLGDGIALQRIGTCDGSGSGCVIDMPMPGLVPYVIIGSSASASMRDGPVVDRALVGRKLLPARDRGVPLGALRRVRAALQIFERRVVGRDQAGARAAFDRHVADRHALFHRERADGAAGEFEDAAGAAADADLARSARG